MGGRGSYSKTSKAAKNEPIAQQINDIESQMEEVGKTMSKYASDATGWPNKVPGATEDGYKKYHNALREYQTLRAERDRLIDKQVKNAPKQKATRKTFVNSYGEATTRTITSPTYERAMKRQQRAVLRNMGY